MKFYYVTKVLDLQVFGNETSALLKFFEICTEMRFVYLFFVNKRNITTSLLMIHLKYSVVHCANLLSILINEPFLNYVPSNIPFFLDFLFIFILTRLLLKTYEKTIIFLFQISKLLFKIQCTMQYQDFKPCDTEIAAL